MGKKILTLSLPGTTGGKVGEPTKPMPRPQIALGQTSWEQFRDSINEEGKVSGPPAKRIVYGSLTAGFSFTSSSAGPLYEP